MARHRGGAGGALGAERFDPGEDMRILDDLAMGGDSRAFAVEMELGEEAGDAALRAEWASVDDGEYGVPHALVLYGGGKVEPAALRAALERFNEEPSGDGWRWTVEALAMHLLDDLCGIALADRRAPPRSGNRGGT